MKCITIVLLVPLVVVAALASNCTQENLYPLQKWCTKTIAPDGRLHYSFGAQVKGDRLLIHKTGSKSWDELSNVKMNMDYSSIGDGRNSVVTNVDIFINQEGTLGDVHIVKCSPGQQDISFVIISNATRYIEYDLYFYGH